MEKIFFRFLKLNDAFFEFKNEFCKESQMKWRGDSNCSIKKYLNKIPSPNYIMDAFFWKKTHGGDVFWQQIHRKWLFFINKYL